MGSIVIDVGVNLTLEHHSNALTGPESHLRSSKATPLIERSAIIHASGLRTSSTNDCETHIVDDPSDAAQRLLTFRQETGLVGALVGTPSSLPNQTAIRSFPFLLGRATVGQSEDEKSAGCAVYEPLSLILRWIFQILEEYCLEKRSSSVPTVKNTKSNESNNKAIKINPVVYVSHQTVDCTRIELLDRATLLASKRLALLSALRKDAMASSKRLRKDYDESMSRNVPHDTPSNIDPRLNVHYSSLKELLAQPRPLAEFTPITVAEHVDDDISQLKQVVDELSTILKEYDLLVADSSYQENSKYATGQLARWAVLAAGCNAPNDSSSFTDWLVKVLGKDTPSLLSSLKLQPAFTVGGFVQRDLLDVLLTTPGKQIEHQYETKIDSLHAVFENRNNKLAASALCRITETFPEVDGNQRSQLYINADVLRALEAVVDCPFSIDNILLGVASSNEVQALAEFVAFWTMTHKYGWSVASGLKFGAEFLAYTNGDPWTCHAEFMVAVTACGKNYPARMLIANSRLASAVRKKFSILDVDFMYKMSGERRVDVEFNVTAHNFSWAGWT